MAFLDNSGDIILDAVLTDEGRKRLAAGDGSFRIVKFALGDDEIDYALYENGNHPDGAHTSGSAYYDLSILQSPILEAVTNNQSGLRSKLINYTNNNYLFLPVIKQNTKVSPVAASTNFNSSPVPALGYLMGADITTSNLSNHDNVQLSTIDGFLSYNAGALQVSDALCFDQGLDSNDLAVQELPAPDPRRESQYLVEVDNRLFKMCSPVPNGVVAVPSYIDDDQIATYMFMENTSTQYFATNQGRGAVPKFGLGENVNQTNSTTVIGSIDLGTGRYGSRFAFILKASLDIQNSAALFNQIGYTDITNDYGVASAEYYVIDTVVRITGYTTGYRTDIPIKILKKSN
jgi:hypothetical protein|tara:strand:+ start:131 stop:1168 length:1038 start_codon:yes stop_codon:yes gene_type:complete